MIRNPMQLTDEISLQDIIDACDGSRIPSAELLNKFWDKIPGEGRMSKGRHLSELLKRFDVYALNVRFGHVVRRGYKTCDFVFARDGRSCREVKPVSARV